MSLLERTVGEFLSSLASDDPTPGGGSAAALAAAQAAALVAMVARLSAKEHAEAADVALRRAERLRAALADLVDADAQAFDAVMAAYRLPKGAPEEQTRRRDAVQRALIAASEVPLRVADRAVEVLAAAAGLVGEANPNAVSDLGVAAVLAEAGAAGAGLNVLINARSVRDEAVRVDLRRRADQAESEARRLRAQVIDAVTRRLAAS